MQEKCIDHAHQNARSLKCTGIKAPLLTSENICHTKWDIHKSKTISQSSAQFCHNFLTLKVGTDDTNIATHIAILHICTTSLEFNHYSASG